METINKGIYLNQLLEEFITLGVELGFIGQEKERDVRYRLGRVCIVEDNSISSDVETHLAKETYTIYVNTEKCKDESYRDEIIFSELAHLVNNIHLDLYFFSHSDIKNLAKEYSDLSLKNEVVGSPVDGVTLIDECFSHYVSLAMISKKYNKEFEEKRYTVDSPTAVRHFSYDNSEDKDETKRYKEKLKATKYFAEPLYNDENSMKRLCKDLLGVFLLEKLFGECRYKENGFESLYETLGFLGTVNKALTPKKANKPEEEFGDMGSIKKYLLQRIAKNIKNQAEK